MNSKGEALRKSEERLKLAQVAAGAGIWDWNILTGKIEWSEELFILYGLNPATTQASFETWRSIIHPDDRAVAAGRIENAVRDKTPLESEYRIIFSTGEHRWIRALGNTIYDNEGKPVRMLGICLDITSQKENEKEQLRLVETVQNERDRFAALVNSITDEIWFADKDGKVTLVNSAVLKEFGSIVREKPVIAKVAEKLEVYHSNGTPRPVAETPLLRALNGEIITNEEEIIRIPATGTLKNRQVNASPVYDSDGSVIGSVFVARDITRRKLNQKLIEYNEQRNRVLSEVASELLISQDIQKAITNICQIVMKFLDCQFFFNFHFVPELNKLQLNASWGLSKEETEKMEWLNLGDAVCGCVAQRGKRVIAENIQESKAKITKLIKSFGIRAYCCHPLLSGESVLGTLSFGTTNRDNWTDQEVSMMETISGLMSVAIQRKKLEEELIKSREDLERAQRIGKIGNWRLNLIKNELIWSDEVYRIFGIAKGIPQSYESFLSLIHPEDREYVNSKWAAALAGQDYDIEHRITADGTIKWVREKAFLEFDENRTLLAAFGISQDITKRKNAETDLIKAKMKLDMALENADIGLWEHDFKSNIIYLDERSEKMFGLKPGSFDGTFESFGKLIHEEDLDRIRKEINKTVQNKLPYEIIFRTKPVNGRCRYISSRALVNEGLEGNVEILSGVNFDITELREGTERLISKLNTDLLRSNSDLQQFAYVASHDLQEPLRMVSSFVQLLKMKYADKLDKDANEYINYAVDGSRRMYELINGLLAYSRVQTRTEQLKEVNMESVLAKVRENLKLLIHETKAVVKNDQLPLITADENQMIQVLQNLIENAIKFRKGAPEIHISCIKQKGMCVFSVKDDGIGIEHQYFERIFRIFQKLHTHQEYKGTGIGLAICKRIIERHGGEIWVKSDPGMGSEFFFTIPV